MSTLSETIKRKLFAEWLPDKPGGLRGLITMAAECATNATGEEIEALTQEVVTLTARVEALLQPTPTREAMGLPELDEDDEHDEHDEHGDGHPDAPANPSSPPISSYECTDCGHSHNIDSRIGSEHLVAFMEEQEQARAAQVVANVEAVNPSESG